MQTDVICGVRDSLPAEGVVEKRQTSRAGTAGRYDVTWCYCNVTEGNVTSDATLSSTARVLLDRVLVDQQAEFSYSHDWLEDSTPVKIIREWGGVHV